MRTAAICAALLLLSCASAKLLVINQEKAKAIKTWAVVPYDEDTQASEAISTDSSLAAQTAYYMQEFAKITNDMTAQASNEASLIDRIKFTLTGSYRLLITSPDSADGLILVSTSPKNPWLQLTFDSIFIRFTDKSRNVFAQIEVDNADGLGRKDYEAMSKLAAEKIAEAILSFR